MIRGIHIQEALRFIPWLSGGLLAAAVALYASLAPRLSALPVEERSVAHALEWPEPPAIQEAGWSVFAPGQQRLPVSGGPLSRRFRLAGTFFSFVDKEDAAVTEPVCKAILDDLEKKTQHLLREGETLDGVQVAQVHRDHVVLRSNGREEELWLSFSPAREKTDKESASSADRGLTQQPLETSRFGTRVGEHRWVLNRDALMAYYEELREDPERVGHLYVSMRPDYQEDSIAGYRLNMTGEEDFFKAAGLNEGDVVRKVNSLRMTSQARAEYFIGEFLQGRLNAVVLDIERDGEDRKLIYLIR